MSKYLITGRQGTGKTTVINHLRERGFTAYNTDDLPEVTRLENIKTGESISWPKNPVDWTRYAWNWQEQQLLHLLNSDDTVFIGAVVSNQEKFYPLFDKVFILTIDADLLRERLSAHEHESHHLPGEIERLVTDHAKKQSDFIKDGTVPISSAQPIDKVVDEILGDIGLT